jgi:hypothetical protein
VELEQALLLGSALPLLALPSKAMAAEMTGLAGRLPLEQLRGVLTDLGLLLDHRHVCGPLLRSASSQSTLRSRRLSQAVGDSAASFCAVSDGGESQPWENEEQDEEEEEDQGTAARAQAEWSYGVAGGAAAGHGSSFVPATDDSAFEAERGVRGAEDEDQEQEEEEEEQEQQEEQEESEAEDLAELHPWLSASWLEAIECKAWGLAALMAQQGCAATLQWLLQSLELLDAGPEQVSDDT